MKTFLLNTGDHINSDSNHYQSMGKTKKIPKKTNNNARSTKQKKQTFKIQAKIKPQPQH